MQRQFLLLLFLWVCGNGYAQTLDSIFENPAVQEINRMPMRASYFPFEEITQNIVKKYGKKLDLRPISNKQVITIAGNRIEILENE